jgi:hypothetical protein
MDSQGCQSFSKKFIVGTTKQNCRVLPEVLVRLADFLSLKNTSQNTKTKETNFRQHN